MPEPRPPPDPVPMPLEPDPLEARVTLAEFFTPMLGKVGLSGRVMLG